MARDTFQNDTFDLILQVKRSSYTLSDAILAFDRDGVYFVPVSEIAELTGLFVEKDLEQGVIKGWFFKPEKTYELNFKDLTYSSQGITGLIPPEKIIVEDQGGGFGEVFIAISLLNEILPLELRVDFSNLHLRVETPFSLPFEAKNEREALRNNRGELGEDLDYSGFLKVDNDYKMLSLPVFSIGSTLSYTEGGTVQTTDRFQGKNDFLGFSASYNLSLRTDNGRIKDPSGARFTLNRKDYGQGTLPYGIKSLSLGDISTRSASVLNNSRNGAGIRISNRTVDRDRSFDTVTLTGIAQPGWEIEVYRNLELLEFGTVPEDGEYRFEDVELIYGQNEFRILLYGPQGQIEERTESYNVSGSLLKPGQITYDASYLHSGTDVLSFLTEDGNSNGRDGNAASLYIARGMNKSLSIFGQAYLTPIDGTNKTFVSLGSDVSLPFGIVHFEAFKDIKGGSAYDARLATRLLGWNIGLDGTAYNDFESDKSGVGQFKKLSEGRVRASRSFRIGKRNLNLQLRAQYEDLENSGVTYDYGVRTAYGWDDVRVNNILDIRDAKNTELDVSGQFNSTVRLSREWQFRTGLNYKLRPDLYAEDARLQMRYRPGNNFNVVADFEHDFETHDLDLGLQTSYDFGSFLGSVDANWNKTSGTTVVLRTTTSLAPWGDDGEYISSSEDFVSRSGVRAHIFEDFDGDGEFDEDDAPLDQAKIFINGVSSEKADQSGYVVDAARVQEGRNHVTFNAFANDNPFLVSSVAGYDAIARPGTLVDVAFPLIETGSIDGTVYFESGAPLQGMAIQLLDEDEEVIQETASAYDGFYIFEFVLPGSYTVRADLNETSKTYGFVPPREIVVASEDLYQYGMDLIFMEQAQEAVSVESVRREHGKIAQFDHDSLPSQETTEKPHRTKELAHISESGLPPSATEKSGARTVTADSDVQGRDPLSVLLSKDDRVRDEQPSMIILPDPVTIPRSKPTYKMNLQLLQDHEDEEAMASGLSKLMRKAPRLSFDSRPNVDAADVVRIENAEVVVDNGRLYLQLAPSQTKALAYQIIQNDGDGYVITIQIPEVEWAVGPDWLKQSPYFEGFTVKQYDQEQGVGISLTLFSSQVLMPEKGLKKTDAGRIVRIDLDQAIEIRE
jgi:hypothetical protein